MRDVIKLGKKAFTWSVVVMTIMWSVGLAALTPATATAAECPALEAGDLFKVPDNTAVYYLNADMKRMYFPSSEVYHTWYDDFSGVVEIPNTCVDAYPAPSSAPYGINYRPGSRLVKVQISPSVYAVLPNNTKAKISDPDVASALYGDSWATLVRDVADVYWPNYANTGSEITSATPHDGLLVTEDGETTYHVVDGMAYEVDGEVLNPGEVQTVTTATFNNVEMGSGTVTAASVVDDPSQLGGMPTDTGDDVTYDGNLTVALSADTPASGYVAKGAYNAEFAKFTFTATSGDVRVDKIVIERDGLSDDDDVDAVRLYDGWTKLGSDQAINTTNHRATFKNLNWDLSSGETKTLTVKVDVASGADKTNLKMTLVEVELENGGSISASLPIEGNAMQYHTVTPAVVDVDAKSSPAAAELISGSTDQEVACFNFDTNANEGVYVHNLTLTNAGTVADDDIEKFVVKEGVNTLGTYVGGFTSGEVTIDFSSDPYFIDKSKSKDLCVYVDIAGGIKDTLGKTIILQIAESSDVTVYGDDSAAQILVTKDDATTFTSQSSQTMTIAQGTLTVTLNGPTKPTATNLVDGVEHNKIAAYKFTAGSTEGASITRLRLTVSGTNVGSADFSNFELYTYDADTAEETMVGSSQSISGSYVTFEDTSDGLFTVPAGENLVLHVYADVNTAAAYSNFNVFIGDTNSDLIIKAEGVDSGEFINYADISLSSVNDEYANIVLFGNSNNGTLTVSLDGDTPAATSVAKGQNDVEFLYVKLYATGEDMDVSAMTFRAYKDSGTATNLAVATADNLISNVQLYDVTDSDSPVELGSAVSSPASGVASFSFDVTVPKDSYKVLKLIADVPSNASTTTGVATNHVKWVAASSTDDITTTGNYSGQDITESGSAVGKNMTIATPAVSVSWGVTPPASSIVQNAQEVHVGTINLTAGAYEDVKINSLKVYADDATSLGTKSEANDYFTNLKLMSTDGATQYGTTKNLTNGSADYVNFDGITNLTVTKGQVKQVYLYTDIANTASSTFYFGTRATTDLTGAGATSGGTATITGTGTSTAQTAVSSATVTFAAAASNPKTSVVAVGATGTGTEVSVLEVDVDAQYEDVDMTKLVFSYVLPGGDAEDNAAAAFSDAGVKLYHQVDSGDEVLVGSTSMVYSSSTAYTATFVIAQGSLRIDEDADNTLIVKVVHNGTNTGVTSASSPLVQLGQYGVLATTTITAKGVQSGTELDDPNITGLTASARITGNQKKLYKSFPTFTHVSLGTTSMTPGAEQDVFKFKVGANGNGPVALKQLKFTVDIVDRANDGTDDDHYVASWKLYRNDGSSDENLTSTVLIQDDRGVSLEGATNAFAAATGTGKSVYVTWPGTNEEVVPAGSEYTYTLKATPTNFNTDAQNDYIRIRLANGQSTSGELNFYTDSKYLGIVHPHSAGTAYTNLLAIYSSTTASGYATTAADIIWSDKSASSHSAATGAGSGAASSTADWSNGYYITETPTVYSQLIY